MVSRVVSVLSLLVCVAGALSAGAGDCARDLLDATCRVANRSTSATCLLLTADPPPGAGKAPVVLVTAGHFMEGTPEADCQLIARVRAPDGSFVRSEVPLPVRDGDTPRWKKHADVDIAALRVELPDGLALRPLRLAQLATPKDVEDERVRVGQDVLIPCYPAKLEANEAGWPILRKGMIATYPLAPVASARTFLVDVSTFGGDSGAPVAVAGQADVLVAGIVVGMQRQTDRSSLPFEEKTVHMPLGLAIVVQAAFVRETVDALGQ